MLYNIYPVLAIVDSIDGGHEIVKAMQHIYIYPVLCLNLTLIQPTWSAYPYHLVFLIWYPYSFFVLIWYPYALTSLYGNTAHCSGYGVPMGCYGHKDCYCDVTLIWPLLFHGIREFNAICYAFLRNNPIYIEGRNCGFSTVPVLFNKCSGLRPSDTLSSWWLGWRRHARVGKPFFGKSLDL